MNFSPLWVICALDDNEFSLFEKKLDRQFRAVSDNEMDGFCEKTHKWWKITNIPATARKMPKGNIDEQGHPSDVPAFDAQIGTFDLYKCTVVFYAPAEYFARLFVFANEIQSLHEISAILLFK